MRKLELHWKIIIGMLLGLVFGFIMTQVDGGKDFSNDWIKPIGTIFIKLLKLIAIPLILASLIKGISVGNGLLLGYSFKSFLEAFIKTIFDPS